MIFLCPNKRLKLNFDETQLQVQVDLLSNNTVETTNNSEGSQLFTYKMSMQVR